MATKRLTSFIGGVIGMIGPLAACSWDYPVWPKSKRSDTPLFRFVVRVPFGAGYIDRQGRVVIEPQYHGTSDHGGDFFDGLARVTTKDREDFYIDARGNRVARAHYLYTGDFSEGLATSWFPDKRRSGYINRRGVLVIPAEFEEASDFREGLAAVMVRGRYGYINRSGRLVIPARFAYAASFSDGHALVIQDGPCALIGYGPCEYPLIPPRKVPRGTASPAGASLPRCHYSVIDKTGKVVFSGPYIDAKPFAEGLAPTGDGKRWGYVDYAGKVRIPLQFEAAEPFSEGLGRIRINGKAGFVDKTGAIVIQPQFFDAQAFSEGLAVVMNSERRYWFIDRRGRRAIAGDFDAASGFVMGLAHVRQGRDYTFARWSYIDRAGKAVFTYTDQSKAGEAVR